MDKAASEGVRVFEITGGECTTYPHFIEVLDHAAKLFNLVGVIINGYAIGKSKELQDAIGSHSHQVLVQISIDGLREYHDKFRKMPGSFDACIEAIKALKRYGTLIRVATSVTQDNVGQLREIFHIVKRLGVNVFTVSPVTQFGRGVSVNDIEQQHLLMHKINSELGEFSNDPLLAANRPLSKPRNCGAGSRTFAVNYKGDIRSCLFLADAVSFGNIRSSDYQKVFGQDVMFNFSDAPSPGGDDCIGCKYRPVCNGCFAKAFKISEMEYPECPWRKKWFPNITLNFKDSSCGSVAGCGGSLDNNDLIRIRSVRQ